ncbi:hypothetical protein D3C76_1322400 [compost metagenome]
MHHRIADLDSCRVTVDQQTPGLALQQRHQCGKVLKVCRFGNQGRGQLAMQALHGTAQLRLVSHFHHHGGRAEHFFLQ